jgi:exodeoxyribonuclease VII small subunit
MDVMEEVSELKFEAAMEELETVVGRLEEEELPLEGAIALFERGQALLARCQGQLTAAELKVEQLTLEGT